MLPLCYFTLRSKWYETNILDVFYYLPNGDRMTISFIFHGWLKRGHHSYVRYDIMQPRKWRNVYEAEVITTHYSHIYTIKLLNVSSFSMAMSSIYELIQRVNSTKYLFLATVCILTINCVSVKSVGGNGLNSKNIPNITYQTIQVSFFISEKAV